MALQILLCCLAAGGIIGLLLELKAPGIIIPGVAGLLCLIAFFWLQAGGNTVFLAAGLFVLGVALIVLEVAFCPGTGSRPAAGSSWPSWALPRGGRKHPETADEWTAFGGRVIRYGFSTALAFVVAAHLGAAPPVDPVPTGSSWPRRKKGRPKSKRHSSAGSGRRPATLRPGGRAGLRDRPVDVVAEWDFIAVGERVQVVEVEGQRVVVRSVRRRRIRESDGPADCPVRLSFGRLRRVRTAGRENSTSLGRLRGLPLVATPTCTPAYVSSRR